MAGGLLAVGDGNVSGFGGRLTASVVITCIVAASGGLIFGYDIGISGGVTTMEPFLQKFFPSVLRKMLAAEKNVYCIFNSQALTSFTSSLYIAGMAASFVASRLTRALGRRATMVLGGFTFFIGAVINGAAVNIEMLILGRILLGFGVGFTNQATPVYLSEMAPPKWRGAFNTGFQFFLGTGVVIANALNYGSSRLKWGWRLSLGLAALPAMVMTIGALLISDTPSSLVERGKLEKAEQSLRRARGVDSNVEAELNALIKTTEAMKAASQEPFKTIFERQYRPHFVMSVAIPLFTQLTGINVIAFYAPVLFQSVGFGSSAALMAALILGVVNLGSILVSTGLVDRYGRRVLFLQGGIQMILGQVAVASVLGSQIGVSGSETMSKNYAILVLVLMCVYAAGFGWSWGPLSWLVPSEIFPLKIRPTGQSISVAVNLAGTFVLAQTFLSMLCHFKFGIFLFYAGWIAIMTLFVALFLPETKGVPLELMHTVWENHWYWRRFVKQESPTTTTLPKQMD
ncbi:sugar transport protein 5-like [Macadamia integrifolia]|uniref:sugar transport protein 5-like n=1 Tax=Macadamia integrifolia TaxID=60698 RepID=UPI001C4E82C1|nr:sugar transport protein 5-like [Macadamia integrifolia]